VCSNLFERVFLFASAGYKLIGSCPRKEGKVRKYALGQYLLNESFVLKSEYVNKCDAQKKITLYMVA
jgi:hypothetical protein